MDAFLAQPTSHSHALQPDRVPAIQLKNDIKVRAVITDEPSSSILHSVLRTYPLSAAGEFPSNEALMLMIRRQRTVETVDIDGRLPEKLRKTYRDEDFILHEDKNLIIFTTKTNLSILKQNKYWFDDGTFKVNYQLNVSLFFSNFLSSVWRQVQNKGLTTKYNEDEYFRLNVKKLIALAFVPLDQVITGFDLICDQFDDDADDLLDYFAKNMDW
ncbi:unnamed protein product [Rotaria sp. Silwood2]|nr:unnamed protein product [Rotaria sp. Silwood2]CAF2673226.1 unnamed protein product [Rotaria sp. Silwood2]